MSFFNVAKFGGTSMADFEAMQRCAQIVMADQNIRLVVVSASSGITNKLTTLASTRCTHTQRDELIGQIKQQHVDILRSFKNNAAISGQLEVLLSALAQVSAEIATCHSLQRVDEILSFGEQLSSLIFCAVLKQHAADCERFDARDVMQTDSVFGHGEPQIDKIEQLAREHLLNRCQNNIVVTQGFIGRDQNGATTTLGRGGSDYSAALFAEALGANNLQIWTDVDGIYTTDPRIAPKARAIAELNFNEAAELSTFGAKVLHPSTLWPAIRQNISVFVGSSRDRLASGTWIKKTVESAPNYRAIAKRAKQTLVTVNSLNMLHSYGFLAKVFAVLSEHKISVDLVTTSEVSVALTLDALGSEADDSAGLLNQVVIDELSALGEVKIDQNLALVALVGNNIESQSGVSAKVFNALSEYNLRLICHGASGHNICFLVAQDQADQVVCRLHQELFETEAISL
jgi:aspartate kinase